jgi:RNA polymerase sigma-70 factor (ECF subfamily)
MTESGAGSERSDQTSDLIQAAQAGSAEALGRLLEACRAYLLLIANQDLDPDLQAKGGASDLIQDTFLEAQHDFAQFQGRTQRDLLNWLRGILRHNLADFRRSYRERAARQIAQEQPLAAPENAALAQQLLADTGRPEQKAATAEEVEAVRMALARLSEDYRRVIALRYEQGQSFADIGQAMDRSAEAVRKLWFRAIERLRKELNAAHESG